MVLIIDNYDSFTYNLYQQIGSLGHEVKVVKHDLASLDDIAAMQPSHIIISPGPRRPDNSGISLDVIKHFYKTVPILGVCLGHQCIGQIFGSKIVNAPRIMHGKTDMIYHNRSGLFQGIDSPFEAARYHSLVIDSLPEGFTKTAWSDDGSIMGIQHETYPLYGVQFHPESFMTESGNKLMENFLK